MKLNTNILKSLSSSMHFQIEENEVVIFGIRGCLPKSVLEGNFKTAATLNKMHLLHPAKTNYRNSRCTIGIWLTRLNQIAVFPGSTVPSINYLNKNPLSQNTFNLLSPGLYQLTKGIHPRNPNSNQRHSAFLMNNYGLVNIPKIKNKKLDFTKIYYEVRLPGDNLHASRVEPDFQLDKRVSNKSTLNKDFSSSGCIVIIGQPEAYISQKHDNYDWNSWECFMKLMSRLPPKRKEYKFILFDFDDFKENIKPFYPNKIRYGSSGSEVEKIQKMLSNILDPNTLNPYYSSLIDGLYDKKTGESILKFQQDFSKKGNHFEVNVEDFLLQTKHFNSTKKNKYYAFN